MCFKNNTERKSEHHRLQHDFKTSTTHKTRIREKFASFKNM